MSQSQCIDLFELKIFIEIVDSKTIRYKFNGRISQKFSHSQVPIKKHPQIIFDLESVSYISSVGIREWILVVNKFQNQKVYFTKCSIYFVDQMNMVPDCLGLAKVRSFYAPYYRECEDCDGEKNCLINLKNHPNPAANLPAFNCSDCQKDLEFDALEESYFSFLDHKNSLVKKTG